MRPSVYKNVARQLNISVSMECMVTDDFLAVASEIFSTGEDGDEGWGRKDHIGGRGEMG